MNGSIGKSCLCNGESPPGGSTIDVVTSVIDCEDCIITPAFKYISHYTRCLCCAGYVMWLLRVFSQITEYTYLLTTVAKEQHAWRIKTPDQDTGATWDGGEGKQYVPQTPSCTVFISQGKNCSNLFHNNLYLYFLRWLERNLHETVCKQVQNHKLTSEIFVLMLFMHSSVFCYHLFYVPLRSIRNQYVYL